MARNKLGEIPDDHWENEPSGPAKNVTPLSKEWEEKIKDRAMNGTDKYKPGDYVGGYSSRAKSGEGVGQGGAGSKRR